MLLLGGGALRLTHVAWDEGHHVHPDERFISMVEEKLVFPKSVTGYFDSSHSTLNPYNRGHDSFVYGTFPIFLTKAVAETVKKTGYDGAYLVGRILSGLFDLFSIWITYLLARRFAGRGAALSAAALIAFCPLGIQLSHFWAVDTFLVTFATLTLFGTVRLAQGKSTLLGDAATGVALGLAVACKVTALALLAPVGVAVVLRALALRSRSSGKSLGAIVLDAAGRIAVVIVVAAAAVRTALPYAFLGLHLDPRYIRDMKGLVALSQSVAGFPPALQWAGRTVLFPLYNFVFWGAGPFFGITALAAFLWGCFAAWKGKNRALLPLLAYAAVVCAYHGLTMVKSIRYFYPAYPVFAVLSVLFLAALANRAPASRILRFMPALVVGGTLLAGFAFSSIYRRPHTRLEASRWMYDHVPTPARFANEAWDDGVPYSFPGHDSSQYAGPSMDLWGPDNAEKIEATVKVLGQSDWVAVTSGRVYTNITRLPVVFPMTTAYYRALFEDRLGFERAAEFTSYPSLGPLRFPDDRAEEQFTVYDHPRVLLFRKTRDYSEKRARSILAAAMPKTPPTIWEWEKWPRANRRVTEPVRPAQRIDVEKSSGPTGSGGGAIGSIPAALLFYLAILIIGAVAFPLTYGLFSKMEDRGAGFARIFGLVTATFIFSLAVHWRLLANGRKATVVVLLLLAVTSAAAFLRRRAEILAFCREKRGLLLEGELVFAAGFILFAGLRALNPEIYWGEKPMDFSILNILVRTPTLPASDPWFAGAPLGYYTFGQGMIAFLTLLTGLSTAFTFNLAFGWLGGATLQAAFTLARNWAGTLRSAMAGAFFVGLIGNLSGLREWLIGQPGRAEHRHMDWHYFWATSRVIRDTINEYPFWSMTFADLHAHVLAMPLLLLVLAGALQFVRTHADPGSRLPARTAAALLFGFAVATDALTNAWDIPLLAGLLMLTFLVSVFDEGRLSLAREWTAGVSLAVAALSAALFVLPHWVRGGGLPGYGRNSESAARGADILTVYGFFLFLALAWWLVAAYRRLVEAGWPRPLVAILLLLVAVAVGAAAVFFPNVFLIAGIVLFLLGAVRMTRAEDRLACGLVAAGFFLILFTQRYFIYDRMNTFFKLYFEAWILFAIATAVLVFRPGLWRGSFERWARPLRAAFWALVGLGVFTSATAGRGALDGGRPTFADTGPNPGPTLDGLSYRRRAHPGEFHAVLWLRRNIQGTPVVLEAQGPSYQEFSRISMLTGLPTVLGWEYHVQQRGNHPDEIAARREAVRFIYSSPSADAIERVLRRYHVGYVYVGWLEKQTYPAEGLKKFGSSRELFQLAYENPESKIYRVVGGDTQDIILPAREKIPEAEQVKAAATSDEPEEPPSIQDTPAEDRPPFSGMKEPRDAAVDDRGRLFVADFGHSRLRIFNADGGYLGGWGGRGNGEHGFRELCGVAIQKDNVYVADTWNGRIQAFTLSGEWKATASQLYGPRGVAVAPDGNVWVADTGNNRLMVYDPQLGKVLAIGKKGPGPEEFASPVGIAVGSSGSVYVTDAGNRRVEVLDSAGHFLRALPVVGWADGVEPHVEVDDDDTIYVSVPSADAVQQYGPDGSPGERWTTEPSGRKFARPTGLAIDRQTRMLYVVNSANNTVSKIPLPKRKKK